MEEKTTVSSTDKPTANHNTQSTNSKPSSKEEKEHKKAKSSHEADIDDDLQYIEQSPPKKSADINSFDESTENDQQTKSFKQNGISSKVSGSKLNSNKENSSKKGKNYNKTDLSSSAFANNKDESAYYQKWVLAFWRL